MQGFEEAATGKRATKATPESRVGVNSVLRTVEVDPEVEDVIEGDHPSDDARRTVLVDDEDEEGGGETPLPRQRPSLSVTVAPAEEPLQLIRSRSGDLQDMEVSAGGPNPLPHQQDDIPEVASSETEGVEAASLQAPENHNGSSAPLDSEPPNLTSPIEHQEETPLAESLSATRPDEGRDADDRPSHTPTDSQQSANNEDSAISGSSDFQKPTASLSPEATKDEAKFDSILDIGSLDAVPKFVPTKEWVDKLKASLPLSTIMKLLNYLGPLVEHVASKGGSLDALMQLIEDTMMVGILPVPHPIVIRKHSSNQHTSAWMASFVWDLIHRSYHDLPLFDLKHVKLFDVEYA